MASTYVPTAVALGSTTIPDDGDNANASSVNTPIEDIADGVKYLGTQGRRGLAVEDDNANKCQSTQAAYQVGTTATENHAVTTTLSTLAVGEYVIVEATFHVNATAAADAEFALGYVIVSGSLTLVPGARAAFGSLGTDKIPVTIRGYFTAASAGALSIFIQSRSPSAVQTVTVYGPIALSYEIVAGAET